MSALLELFADHGMLASCLGGVLIYLAWVGLFALGMRNKPRA